jgi:hypothetical protein
MSRRTYKEKENHDFSERKTKRKKGVAAIMVVVLVDAERVGANFNFLFSPLRHQKILFHGLSPRLHIFDQEL